MVLLLSVVLGVVIAFPVHRHGRAVALLLSLAGEVPAALEVVRETFAIEDTTVSGTHGAVRARIYRPLGFSVRKPRGVVLAHGVHHLGIDEPRLVNLALGFAKVGVVVLTPELGALADYRVEDPINREALRASVRTLVARRDVVRDGGVGLLGVSFAGGLSLCVASEPDVQRDLAFVGSIGGHNDLQRVARYFVTDRIETPDGEIAWRAHDYGLAVLVYDQPDRFVEAADAPILRRAVRAFLHETYSLGHQEALFLSAEGRLVWDRVFHRDRRALAAKVLAALPSLAPAMAEASPTGKVRAIRVPIYLLHGAHDDVIPPSEARWNAKEAAPGTEVHLLVSAKIGHAQLGEAGRKDEIELVRFMAAMLGE